MQLWLSPPASPWSHAPEPHAHTLMHSPSSLPPHPTQNLPKRPAPNPDASRRIHVGKLTRNVTDAHVKEIFGAWGEVVSARVAMDERVQLSKGYAIVEYATHEAAQDAIDHMDGGQVDGNTVM